jgi:hypothetical protein
MNDVQPGTSQPAAEPIRVEPAATGIEQLTVEQAQTKLDECKADPNFRDRLLKGNGSAEENIWNALIRRVAGKQPEQPTAEPTEAERARAGLEPPAEGPEAYRIEDLQGRPIVMDEESDKVVKGTLLPAAHSLGLSQGDMTMIAAAVQRPMTYEQCEKTLKRVWGRDFDRGLEDFQQAVTSAADRALLEQYPDQLGNNAALIMSVVNAYRRRQGRR